MAEPVAPPAGAAGKNKKRNRMLLIGGGAVLVLLFLYMRSQSSSGSANATSQQDLQTAAQNAALQQQAQDAANSSFGGAGAAQSTDLSPITSALSVIDTDIQTLGSTITSQTGTSAAAAPPPTTSPSTPPPITINVGPAAQPVPTGTSTAASSAPRMSILTAAQKAAGYIAAPFGPTKPTAAPKGFTAVGLGSGNWGYKPPPATKVKGP